MLMLQAPLNGRELVMLLMRGEANHFPHVSFYIHIHLRCGIHADQKISAPSHQDIQEYTRKANGGHI